MPQYWTCMRTGVKQLCSGPWILCQRKFGLRLIKATRETKMQQPRETVLVARVRRQASPMDWRAQAEWVNCHPQHDKHQREGNSYWTADNHVPGFQMLVYQVPSMKESCSLTEDEDRSKASRTPWPQDHKLPQLCNQGQKEGKLRTCSHREHGRNACLVWHAISQKHEWERWENCVDQQHWKHDSGIASHRMFLDYTWRSLPVEMVARFFKVAYYSFIRVPEVYTINVPI